MDHDPHALRSNLARGRAATLAGLAAGTCALLLLLQWGGCARKAPPISSEVVALEAPSLPRELDDPLWKAAPVCEIALILQDMVEPRLLEASTPSVRVQAATDGARIALKIAWADSTQDDTPGAARFCDACAVQFPEAVGPQVPAPQMGEAGRGVEITYWSSSWQARSDGRTSEIRSLYPTASVDHYPFEAASLPPGSPEQKAMADRYAPAHALGNFMDGDGVHVVQDLMAEGPGTLTPAPETRSDGRGRWAAGRWEVVLTRPLPAGLSTGARTQVAFAVWQGSRQEAGARKMRSVWVPIGTGGAR